MIRTVIVDDDDRALELLRFHLECLGGIDVVGEACSGGEALDAVKKLKPEALFLDIRMPDMDGLEVARRLFEDPEAPAIIFATAYDEYAVPAFELHPTDYILKPYEEERLGKAVDWLKRVVDEKRQALKRLQEPAPALDKSGADGHLGGRVPLKIKDKVQMVNALDIMYIQSRDRTVYMYNSLGEEHEMQASIQELEEKLKPHGFARTHRSYLVNIRRIREIVPTGDRTYDVIVSGNGNSRLPISRHYIPALEKLLRLD